MEKYIKYIICSLSLIHFCPLHAQELSWSEQRNFRLSIYNAMESYEYNASLLDETESDTFASLFESGNTRIYNDLLGVSTEPTLTVYEYIRNLEKNTRTRSVIIKNVNIGNLYFNNDRWQADVTFDKETRYYKNGLPIYSKAYYGTEYKMVATFMLDIDSEETSEVNSEETSEVKIVSLTGEIKSDKAPLPDEYFAVRRSIIKDKNGNEIPDPRDLNAIWNDNKFDFMSISEVEFAFVPTTIENVKFQYHRDNDIDVKPIAVEGSKDMYYLRYKPSHWRLKVRSDFTTGDHYKFEIYNDKIETKSESNEFALELGYVIPSSKKLKVGLFFGAGIAVNKFEMALDSWDYSSKTIGSADIDGDAYTRYYSLNNIKQEYSTTDVTSLVYLDFERRFSKWFSMYLDLGAKGYYNINAEHGAFSADYSTYGVYTKYDNLKLDYRSGINGFTEAGKLDSENLSADELKPEEFTYDAFGSLGFRIGITRWLQLDCGATYQMGMTEYIKRTDNILGKSTNPNDVFVMYSASQNKENVRSMIEAATSVKRESLKVNVGIILKF